MGSLSVVRNCGAEDMADVHSRRRPKDEKVQRPKKEGEVEDKSVYPKGLIDL
jgi:hypothetical protein